MWAVGFGLCGVAGVWVSDVGCWVLDFGCWMLGIGCWVSTIIFYLTICLGARKGWYSLVPPTELSAKLTADGVIPYHAVMVRMCEFEALLQKTMHRLCVLFCLPFCLHNSITLNKHIQSNEIFSLSNQPGPLTNGLKYIRIRLGFLRVIRILSLKHWAENTSAIS